MEKIRQLRDRTAPQTFQGLLDLPETHGPASQSFSLVLSQHLLFTPIIISSSYYLSKRLFNLTLLNFPSSYLQRYPPLSSTLPPASRRVHDLCWECRPSQTHFLFLSSPSLRLCYKASLYQIFNLFLSASTYNHTQVISIL